MTDRTGKLRTAEREWRDDHDGRVRGGLSLRSEPIYNTYWWPHPVARARGVLRARVIVGHRYFNSDGQPVVPFWMRKP